MMLITWLDFGEIWTETYFLHFFFQNFRCLFSKDKHSICHISGIVLHWLDTGWTIWPGPLNSPMTLTLQFFKVKFQNSCISGIIGLIDVTWKGSESISYWAAYMTMPFDHIHDLDLEVSRSNFETVVFKEWEGHLTLYERHMGLEFMTMTLTFVWPWSSGWMYQIVTGMTSDVDVPSADLGFILLLLLQFNFVKFTPVLPPCLVCCGMMFSFNKLGFGNNWFWGLVHIHCDTYRLEIYMCSLNKKNK